MSYLPIVYVRGYAATQAEVDRTVDDLFYGFNLGSSHIRQMANGDPEQCFFRGSAAAPHFDHGYSEMFNGSQQEAGNDCRDALRTI